MYRDRFGKLSLVGQPLSPKDERISRTLNSMGFDLEAEKKEILRRYRGLLRAAKNSKKRSERKAIRKAFDVALDAHKDIRRKSGEPYIYHPIAVARVGGG